jgi:MFS family permease
MINFPMKKRGSKNIWNLGLSSFFNDIGSEMISPILPFFITALGGGGVAVGALSGLREGLSSLFKLLGGWLSDKSGKRMPYVFLGYFASIIFRFLLVIANAWQAVIAFVSFERIGKARDAPRDVIISESSTRRGRGFGIHQAMDTAGAIIGTLIVMFLLWKFSFEFKSIILIAGVISALSLIPLFLVKSKKSKPIKKNLFKGVKLLDKKLKYFIFVASVFSIGNFGLYMFLLLRAREMTGSIIVSLGIYAVFNLVWALFTIPFGNLSDKIGRKKVLLIGYVLFLIVSIGFIYSDGLIYLLVLFVLYGFVYAITQSNQKALVSDMSGKMKGTALGFYQFVIGIVSIFGGIIAGALWNISYKVMFSYISVVALMGIVLLWFFRE